MRRLVHGRNRLSFRVYGRVRPAYAERQPVAEPDGFNPR
jgi:hypothetical protein